MGLERCFFYNISFHSKKNFLGESPGDVVANVVDYNVVVSVFELHSRYHIRFQDKGVHAFAKAWIPRYTHSAIG